MKNLFYLTVISLISLLSVPTVLAQYYYPYYSNPSGDMPVYIVPNNLLPYGGNTLNFLCDSFFTKIPSVCYTNLTLPLDHKTYSAGQKIYLQGRVYTPTIGYDVVDPQVHLYFDGSYIGTAYGDFNGNYYFTFTVPSYIYSGYHSISANATIRGCVSGEAHDRVYVEAYEPTFPPSYYTVSNMGSAVFNVKDCSSDKFISAYAVLSPGLYTKSSNTGTIVFSDMPVKTYDYYVSSGGYQSEYGSVSVNPDISVVKEICLNKISPPAPAPPATIVVPPQVDPPVPTFTCPNVATSCASGPVPTSTVYYSIPAVLVILLLVGFAVKVREQYKNLKTPEEF